MKNNRQMIVAATIILSGLGLGAVAAPQAAATYPGVDIQHSAPRTETPKKSDESEKKSKDSGKSEKSGGSGQSTESGLSTKSGKTEKSDGSPTTTKRKSSDKDEMDE